MFENIKNEIDFFIRNNTRFSRKNFVETNEEQIKINLAQNNYIKEVLETFLLKSNKSNLQVLDVGCKNWDFVKGEYEFFSNFSSDFTLDGIELDAHRLYSNFYSRYEVAKYHIKDLKNANYIIGNFLDLSKKYDYILWFLPFVSYEPHKYWGLPKKYFCPEKMLSHAFSILNDGGQMLIINQGEKEKEIQKKMLEKMDGDFEFLGEIKNSYYEYNNKRYGFLVKK